MAISMTQRISMVYASSIYFVWSAIDSINDVLWDLPSSGPGNGAYVGVLGVTDDYYYGSDDWVC